MALDGGGPMGLRVMGRGRKAVVKCRKKGIGRGCRRRWRSMEVKWQRWRVAPDGRRWSEEIRVLPKRGRKPQEVDVGWSSPKSEKERAELGGVEEEMRRRRWSWAWAVRSGRVAQWSLEPEVSGGEDIMGLLEEMAGGVVSIAQQRGGVLDGSKMVGMADARLLLNGEDGRSGGDGRGCAWMGGTGGGVIDDGRLKGGWDPACRRGGWRVEGLWLVQSQGV